MIRVENISKTFGENVVLSQVSLTISPAERLVLSGISGSGKTTLLRIITGLEEPDSGTVEIDNQPVSTPRIVVPPHQRGIGVVLQQAALWPHMTVAGNLNFVIGNLDKSTRKHRLDTVADLCKISELLPRMPDTLSTGQSRRVALARALIFEPRYLLMDEPTSNLDPEARTALNEVIVKYVTEKQTGLLYISHDATDIAQIGGRHISLPSRI